MPTTQQLREQRANIWEQMKDVMDTAEREGRSLSAEETAKYDAAEKDFDRVDGEVARAERHEARSTSLEAVDRRGVVAAGGAPSDEAPDELYTRAFAELVRNGITDLTNDELKALRSGYVKTDTKEIRAAGGVGTGSAGGYLVPEGYRQGIIERQKAFGAVQQVATVLTTNTGNPLPWATNDDTGNVGALLAENTVVTEQDFVFGTAQLGAYKYTSKLVRESIEFLQDVDWMDVEAFLQRKFAERLGRIHNQHFTTGTGGGSQPQGIVTGATSGVTAAAVAAITADELIDLQHSVDPAYRNERARFMLSDTALKVVRKLKASGTGEYLFQTSTSADVPNLIAGSPYVVNNDMAVPATGVKSVLFGDFEAGYVVRIVKAMELIRLAERYAEYGQVGFIAFDRVDGLVQDANAYKALTQA